jgi:Zn-dependent peptidase ImmA (M78 family)
MELRHAADRRNIALELLALDKKDVPSFNLTSTMGDDPERVAERIRDLLNINDNQQQRWKDNRIAFNALREAGEAAGIIIFQATGVRVEEMRGFSISEYPLPAVVVNRKDAYAGRSFTLIHEIAHLTLRTNGLCDLASPTNDYQGDSAEVFCNYVAGATIAPARLLLADRDIATAKKPLRWSDDKLAALARQFSTSREMILRRLLILNLTTGAYYEEKRKQYVEELKLIKREGRFLSPPKDVISSAGRKYTRTVLEALNAGHITANDASDYLGLRLKHLHVISESIGV